MHFIELNKTSSLPMHVQISKSIKEALRSGNLKPDDQLPTEEELSITLGVSRPVVRQAYRSLMEEHLIYRYKGRGSFVAHPKVEYNLLQSVNSLTQQIQALGLNTYIKELSFERVPYDPDTMSALELEKDEHVYRVERLYYGDKKALFYFDMMVPERYFPDLNLKNLNEQPFMKIVQEAYTVHYAKSSRTFKAVILSPTICDYLALPEKSAGFCMENISWDHAGHIIELSNTFFGGLSSKISFDYDRQP